MKKYSILLGAAFSLFALASCQKEVDVNIPESENAAKHIPFVLKADVPETRTTLDADTWEMAWEAGDIIYAVTTDEEWGAPYSQATPNLETIAEYTFNNGAFTTSSTITDGEHTFNFLYMPANQKSYHRGAGSTFQLYANQAMDADAPTANLKDYDALAGQVVANSPTTFVNVSMDHLFTLMKVTLKNKTGEAITVDKFEMIAPDKVLASVFTVSFGNTPTITPKSGATTYDKITVTVTGGEIAAGGELPIYFVMAPLSAYTGEITFMVTTSDNQTYTKTNQVSNLSFAAGTYNTANYSLKTADVPEEAVYTRITSQNDLTTGDYVIVGEQTASSWGLLSYGTIDGNGRLPYTKTYNSANELPAEIDSPNENSVWHITVSSNSVTLYNASHKRYMKIADSGKFAPWQVSEEDATVWDVSVTNGLFGLLSGSYYLGVNKDYNYWRGYASGTLTATDGLALYKKDENPETRDYAPISWGERTTATVSMNGSSFTWTDPAGSQPSLSNAESLTVVYSSSDPTVATIDASTGAITLVGPGSTVINAVYAGAEGDPYRHTEVAYTLTITDDTTYTITVNQPSVTGCSISATPNEPQKAGTQITLAVTATAEGYLFNRWIVKDANNAAVTVTANKFNMPASNVTVTAEFIEEIDYDDFTWDLSTDNTVTKSESELSWNYRGVTMSVGGSSTAANNYCPPSQNSTRFYSGSTLTITPYSSSTIGYVEFTATTVNYASALANASWTNASATVNGTTVTVTPSNGANAFSASLSATCGFTAVKVYYTGELAPVVTKTITFTQPTETGCSFTVKVNGTTINSGDSVEKGKTVTLTATAGTGYAFASWAVTGATVSGNTPSATFVVGDSDVTISASFTSSTSVVYDFTVSGWSVSNGTLTNGEVSFTGAGGANFKMNDGYFFMGKKDAYLTFPAYSNSVKKIVVTGRSGASASVGQNIFVGNTAVSTETTGATGENTYSIASDYQAAGTIYTLKVTTAHNTQITRIEVFFN